MEAERIIYLKMKASYEAALDEVKKLIKSKLEHETVLKKKKEEMLAAKRKDWLETVNNAKMDTDDIRAKQVKVLVEEEVPNDQKETNTNAENQLKTDAEIEDDEQAEVKD